MFGRATIRLGIGPHSSLGMLYFVASCTYGVTPFYIALCLLCSVDIFIAYAMSFMVVLCNRETIYIFMLFMVALCNRADHYIFALWFLSIFFFFYSSSNLSGRRLDVYHTSTHGVALVRI